MSQNQPFIATVEGDGKNIKLEGGLLVPDQGPIIIKGDTISGLTNGTIHQIEIVTINGVVYTYEIVVNGKTYAKLHFYDLTKDSYSLTLLSPAVENHYVDYNSKQPEVNRIHIEL